MSSYTISILLLSNLKIEPQADSHIMQMAKEANSLMVKEVLRQTQEHHEKGCTSL